MEENRQEEQNRQNKTEKPAHKKQRKDQASRQLKTAVLEKSQADGWEEAVNEWKISGYLEIDEESQRETCVCGHEGLRRCYEITNRVTHEKLYPIGSSCIKAFNRKDLSDQVNMTGKLAAAFKKIRYGSYELSDFSPSMLKYLLKNYAEVTPQTDSSGRWIEDRETLERYDQELDIQSLLNYRNQRSELTKYDEKDIEERMKTSLIPVLVRWANENNVVYLCVADCLPYCRYERKNSCGMAVHVEYKYKDAAKEIGLKWDPVRRCWYLPNTMFVEQACQNIRILSRLEQVSASKICPDVQAIIQACAQKGIGKTRTKNFSELDAKSQQESETMQNEADSTA